MSVTLTAIWAVNVASKSCFERQNGAAERAQLLAAGLDEDAIAHRVETGRFHRVMRVTEASLRDETVLREEVRRAARIVR